MKAYLVTATVQTRVVLPDDASVDEICLAAKNNLVRNLQEDYFDNVAAPEEDTECPYGTFGNEKQK